MIQTMVDRFTSRQLERYFALTLGIGALGAAAISLLIGLQQSVWFDEAYSVLLAKRPILDLIHFTAVDAHPPLYYLFLKGWAGIFGWSDVALRSLSAVALGGVVVFGGLLVKRMFGVRAALMAMPFVALSPLLLRYGFEIRMYALAALIGIAATYVLVCALETKSKSRQWKLYAIYAMLVALGMYTHYFMVLLWIAHAVWLAWRWRQDKQPIRKSPWLMALAGGVVLFLPWIPVLVIQVRGGTQATVLQPMTVDALVGIVSFSFLYQPAWLLGGAGTFLVVFIIAALGWLFVRTFRKASKKERGYLWLLAGYLVVPVISIALACLYHPLYIERYISPFIVGVMLLAGVSVSYSTKKIASLPGLTGVVLYAALLFGVAQLADVGNFNFQRLQKPMVKEVAASVGACQKDTTLLAADAYTAIELAYYLPGCEIRFYSRDDKLTGGYAPLSHSPLRIAHPESELSNSTRLLYVYYDKPRLTMPPNLVPAGHETHGKLNLDTYVAP